MNKIEMLINEHINMIDEKAIADNVIAIIKNEASLCSTIYGRTLSASFSILLMEMDNIYDKSHRYPRGEFIVKIKKVYNNLYCRTPIIFNYQIENYDKIIRLIIDEHIYNNMDRFINNITILVKDISMDKIIDEYRNMLNPQVQYAEYVGPMSSSFAYDNDCNTHTCNGDISRRLWERIIR